MKEQNVLPCHNKTWEEKTNLEKIEETTFFVTFFLCKNDFAYLSLIFQENYK